MTSSDDFGRPSRWNSRQIAVREVAGHWANTRGGEIDDHMREADRNVPYEEKPYRDDNLTDAGFQEAKTYNYKSKDDKLLYQVVRYENPLVPGEKQFRQRRHGRSRRDGVEWVADAGLVKVPYNWPALHSRPAETVYYTEGEKDADRLMEAGLLATTLAGQKWSLAAAKALVGRNVIILADNDDKGRENAATAASSLHGFAASVRLIELPGLQRTQDVSDWLDQGHSKEDLLRIVAEARVQGFLGEYFSAVDPTAIPTRKWLYKPHYIRQFCSLTISTGGVGKSSLIIAEALAMVTGLPLLRVAPEVQPDNRNLKVWYWNGEDPTDELDRRIAATIKHYQINPGDVAARLLVSSGRKFPIVIAEETKSRNVDVNKALIQDIIAMIVKHGIDVLIIDPFVTCHRVPENDNAGIERVVKAWAHIADQTNCAVMLVHHSKKTGGDGATVDDGRGASALLAAARSARSLNTMTKGEAEKVQIADNQRRRYFRADLGKTNLTPPAESADWFRLETVDLGNGVWPGGDQVGVVTAWTYPTVNIRTITGDDLSRVQDAVRSGGPWRYSDQSKVEPWVGIVVARTLDLDLGIKGNKQEVRKKIDEWIGSGVLAKVPGRDPGRDEREYVVAGEALVVNLRADAPPSRNDHEAF